MASIKFDITGDANGFVNATRQAEAASGAMTRNIEKEGNSLDSMFKTLAGSAAAFFSIGQANALVNKIRDVRSEFQQLEIAFGTMLQSEEKGSALIMQLTDTAARTPFDLKGIANSAKQLIAYGVAADEVNDTIVRLGNVAAGLSIPLNDLAYLYGTTMTQGRLFTQDLRQFQGRGIPIADELAKQFGVAKDAVGKLVTEGKVGFPEVKKAIEAMTNEGGKFFQLMEKQSASLGGMKSNLEDQFDMMFNEIGQKMQGTIASGMQFASTLIEHYEEIGKALAHVVAGYGLYKAAVVAISAVSKAQYAAEMSQLSSLLPVKQASLNADIESAVAAGHITKEKAAEIVAIRAEAAAHVQNLKAIADEAGAKAVAALTAKSANAEEIAALQIKAIALRESGKSRQADALQMQIQSLQIKQKTLSEAAETAVMEANTARQRANTAATELDTISTKKNTLATNLLTAAKAKLAAVSTALKAALTNPYVLAGAAVVGLVAAIWGLNKALDYEEKAHKNVAKALEEQNTRLEEQKAKAEELMHTISDEASTEMQRVQALEELRKLYPNLFKDMSDQEIKTLSQVEATKKLAEETERLREEELKRMIQQKKESLTATRTVDVYGMGGVKTGTMEVGPTKQYIETTKNEIKELEGELAELKRLRKEAEFNSQPKEVQIVSLSDQIEKLKKENAELDAQIKTALAQKWTLNELGNLNFDWSQSGNADALLAQQEAKNKLISDLEKKLEQIKKDAQNSATTTDDDKKKKHAALTELKTYETAVQATRKIQDLEHRANVAHLNTLKNDAEKERKLREAENKYEIQEIERQKEDYINALTKARVEKLVAKKQKKIDVSAIRKEVEGRADVQLYDDIIADTTKQQEQQTAELVKSELLAYQEMLSSYGNYYAQKLAIATQYEEKIRNAKTEEEKQSLMYQQANDAASIEVDRLQENMNLEGVFAGLGGIFKDVVTPALEEAKAFMKTDKFKQSDFESQQSFFKAVTEMEQALGGTESDFRQLGYEVNQYKDALKMQAQAERLYKVAYDELVVAQDEYAQALATGNQSEIQAAEIRLASAKENETAQREYLNEQEEAVAEYRQAMTTSAITIKSAMDGVVSGLSKMSGGTLAGLYEGFRELGKSADQLNGKFGDALGAFVEKLENLKIIGFIFQILDVLKDGIGTFIDGLLDTIVGAISGILKELFSGQLFITIGKAIAESIYNIFDGLFGGFLTKWLDDAITTRAERQEDLQKSNEDLDKSIQKLSREMDKSYSIDRAKNLRDQNAELQKQMENYQSMIDIENEKKNPDEEKIAEWNAAIEGIENQIEDNAEAAKEAINGISFDSFRDKFLDALLDMGKGVEGLSEDIEEDIRRAMYEALLTDDEFEASLRGLYDSLSNAIETGNTSEIDRIKAAIIDLYEGQEEKAREIDERLGYDEKSDRAASEKGIAQASQDSIDELNGRMTNIQSHTFSINQQMASVVNLTTQILARVTSIDGNTARLREIEDSLKFMKEDISTIATRGITMR